MTRRSGTADALSQVDANSVGLVDPATGKLADEVPVGATPSHIAVGEGAIWVTNADGDTVSRIDPATRTVVQTIPVGSSPSGITTGNGAVWVANSLDGTVSRIDPRPNTVVQHDRRRQRPGRDRLRGGLGLGREHRRRHDHEDRRRQRQADEDAADRRDRARLRRRNALGEPATANRVARIDPATGSVVQTIPVGNGPAGLAFGSGAAWVANSLDGTVSRIDPTTNSVAATIPAGNGPSGVAVGAARRLGEQPVRRHARADRPADERGRAADQRRQPAAGRGHLGRRRARQRPPVGRGPSRRHADGADEPRPDSIDPAVAYDSTSWPILRMTNDGLVAFNQASGLAGTQLVPDLAVSLPTPTDGGRTYTFRLRPTSATRPAGRSRRPTSARRSSATSRSASCPCQYYDGIVGADAASSTRSAATSRAGSSPTTPRAPSRSISSRPTPTSSYKLALRFAYVVPARNAAHDVRARFRCRRPGRT